MSYQITEKEFNQLIGVKESYQAPTKLLEILYDKKLREKVMLEFLQIVGYDLSSDNFTLYFQEVQSDRKTKKQDFTPESISKLTAKLVNSDGNNHSYETYDGCAGTGGMTIAKWQEDRIKHTPFDYKPSFYIYTAEELSNAAIPFLLFNLIIRGMNAIVIHCDVLSRRSSGVFFIQNDYDDHLQFSSLNRLPYSESVAKEFGLLTDDEDGNWVNGFEEELYDEIIESPGVPEHVVKGLIEGVDMKPSELSKFVYKLCGVDYN